MRAPFLKFLASGEFGAITCLFFVALYTWPLLTFTNAGATFRFIFCSWLVHIAVIGASGFAASRAGEPDAHDVDAASDPSSPDR